jgi:hypothetical protein
VNVAQCSHAIFVALMHDNGPYLDASVSRVVFFIYIRQGFGMSRIRASERGDLGVFSGFGSVLFRYLSRINCAKDSEGFCIMQEAGIAVIMVTWTIRGIWSIRGRCVILVWGLDFHMAY